MSDSSAPPEPSGLDRTNKMCRACGAAYTGDTHVGCPAAPRAPSGTIAVPPDPPSSRAPTESVRAGDKPPSTKSSLDAIPDEAQSFADDASKQLNQYILVKQIGRGGMGAVWKAWDRKLTRWVAIKFLLVAEAEDVARFQREAKLAARLRHPNIAPIYEVGESTPKQAGDPVRHYLAMEFVDGASLAEVKRPLPEMLDLFAKVAQGIEAAHRSDVIHRDLKPANIMVTTDGWPYVMDFGLAKAHQSESSISASGSVMGTPAYMPPEQAQGHLDEIDGRTDVYSLGATMYSVFCGQQPFSGQSAMDILMKVVQTHPPTPRSLNPELPDAVDTIIRKAMAKKQADRYQTAQELADDIQRFLSDQQVVARPPSVREPAAPGARRPVGVMIAAVLVTAVIAVSAFLLLNKGGPPPPPPPKGPPRGAPGSDPVARKQDAWLRAWIDVREGLDFRRWEPGDAALPTRANELFSRMATDAALRDRVDAEDWLGRQTREVEQAVLSLSKDRDQAMGIVAWSDVFLAATKGIDALKPQAEAVFRARRTAAAVADYRGSFTLKLAVGPFAEIVRMTREGREVKLKEKFTPLHLAGLEIGEYRLELSHPQHGTKILTIAADQLEDGKTYQVAGRMQGGPLRVTQLP